MLRGGSNSRFKSLLDGLKAEGDLARQEGALTELCDLLCMGTEETLHGFSTDQFLPPLINLINCEASPEIMLQACRGIAYILEAIPQASPDVVRHGSIAPLCSKLMAIQYIDVAEQALMTLHKISKDNSSHSQLLQNRSVSAVLSYLDFFPLSVQRTGMETVSNMCKRVSVENLHMVVDSFPQLSQMLLHSDGKLVEHVCTAFCRLVTGLAGQKEALEQVAVEGNRVIANVWSLTSNCLTDGASADNDLTQPSATLSVDLCTQLLKMLALLASASPKLGRDILAQPDVGKVLRSKILLEKPGESVSNENRRRSSMELSSRSSPQLLREIMALTSSLLPALPQFPPITKTDSAKESKAKGGKASKKSRGATSTSADRDSPGAVNLGGKDKGEEGKAHWSDNHEMLQGFGEQLLEATLSMGSLSVDSALRLDALTALCKLIHYMPGDKVSKFLPRQQICELMSALLASETLQLRFIAIVLIHDLMRKCSDSFASLFAREGIVYAVHKLHEAGSSVPEQDKLPSAPMLSSWTVRTSLSAKNGNTMQEATEADFRAMLAFVCERHLPTSSDGNSSDARVTTVVSELRELGASIVRASEQGNEDVVKENLESIIGYFQDRDKVSTFEMRCSGVCENLIRFLSPDGPGDNGNTGDKGKDAAEKAPEKASTRGRGRKGGKTESKSVETTGSCKPSREVMSGRWDLFLSLIKEKKEDKHGVTTAAQTLVGKLVAALNNTDGFGSVASKEQGAETEPSWSKQSRLMTLPLRLRFERVVSAKDSHKLKDYTNPVVIDPLASVSAIHDFLWPRVRRMAHEIPPAPAVASRLPGGRAEPPADAAAPDRPRRGAAAGKASADESAGSSSGRPKPKREADKAGKGRPAGASGGAGAAASSSRAARDGPASDVDAPPRALVSPWAGPAGMGLGADDEMISDDDGDLDHSMHEMVAATLLGGEQEFDHDEMEDDMDLDHDGEDESMLIQRAQVLDIQLQSESGTSSPSLPSLASRSGGTQGESSSRDRGMASGGRGCKVGSASSGSRSGGRTGSNASAVDRFAAGASSSSNRAGGAGGTSAREESGDAGLPLALGPGPHLRLSVGGRVLENHDVSILEAVLMSMTPSLDSSSKTSGATSSSGAGGVSDPRSALWGSKDRSAVHIIEYAPILAKSDASNVSDVDKRASRSGVLNPRAAIFDEPVQARAGATLGAGGEKDMSLEDLDLPASTVAMLRLVAILQSVHADLPAEDPCRVSAAELVVGNLSSKASCLIRDPLTVVMQKLPDWIRMLLTRFPFLVSHDVRLAFFDLEAFGLVRALKNAGRNRDGRPERQQSLSHTQHRQKVRVGRKHIMESAKHVMEIYTQNTEKAGWTLEVEFSGEVGVGKGPTQEFFTFFCRELQQRNLGLWWDPTAPPKRAGAGKSAVPDHVCPPHGLFPAPISVNCSAQERKMKTEAFQVMGWVCAKAVHDGRLLDLPISAPLCHIMLDRPLELADMALVCPDVYKTLLKLQDIVKKKRAILDDAMLTADEKKEAVQALTYDGVPLEDLCLGFTVPGYDSVVLTEGGDKMFLTIDNVEQYVQLLPKVILVDSVRLQMDAFRSGFRCVTCCSALACVSMLSR